MDIALMHHVLSLQLHAALAQCHCNLQHCKYIALHHLFCKPTSASQCCFVPVQAVLEQEARIAGFKSEVQKSQELHHSSLTRDTDRLQTMLDKVKAEIRQESPHCMT